jgi:uncharacterized membrane protein YeaQ/YmgE (transglycosylase-associated protein family)
MPNSLPKVIEERKITLLMPFPPRSPETAITMIWLEAHIRPNQIDEGLILFYPNCGKSRVRVAFFMIYSKNRGEIWHRGKRIGGKMSLLGFIILLVIAAIAGSIGQALVGYSLGGCLVSIVVGFIGAWLGLWLAGQLGLPELFTINIEGQAFPVVWSIIGSAILTFIVALIMRPRYTA